MTHSEKLWAVVNKSYSPHAVQKTTGGKYMIYNKASDAAWAASRLNFQDATKPYYVAEVIISWSEVHDQTT